MKDNLFFDLDGTIIDPAVGITGSAKHAIQAMGASPLTQQQLEQFIGPPLDESFAAFCGFTPEQIEQAILHFREYFRSTGIHQHTLYPGFDTLLPLLKENGHTLYIATSKPTLFAKEILDGYGLSQYFSGIQGSSLDGPGTSKGDIIHMVLDTHSLNSNNCFMVGDRKHDILGAKQNNMLSAGLLHGYGGEQELTDAGADYILADVPALAKLFNITL